MKYNLALLFMLIFTSTFIYSAWQQDIRVFTVDGINRPIEGAEVTITYQRERFPIYTQFGYDGEVIQKTNSQGYADFSIFNKIKDLRYETRYFYIEIEFDGITTRREKINCPLMGSTCFPNEYIHKVTLNTQRVTLNVKDQSGRAIENALVTYNEMQYYTDSNGRIVFNIPQNRDIIMVVDYRESKRTVRDKIVREDKTIDVTFDRFNVRYRIINDEGVPLNAEVILNDEIKQTDENGYVLFEGIVGTQIEVFARFDEGSREFIESINQDIDKILVMDMTPPSITNIFHEVDVPKNVVFINAKIVDPNPHGTGLRTMNPVRLRYRIGEGGWRTVEMYTVGKDAFQASVPYEKNIIMYEIEATDAQDNIQRYNAQIDLRDGTTPITNGTTDEPIIIEPSTGGFINTTTLIIGAVVLLILAFIGYKFYTGEI